MTGAHYNKCTRTCYGWPKSCTTKNPWNDDFSVNTNKQSFRWFQRMQDLVHPQYDFGLHGTHKKYDFVAMPWLAQFLA